MTVPYQCFIKYPYNDTSTTSNKYCYPEYYKYYVHICLIKNPCLTAQAEGSHRWQLHEPRKELEVVMLEK